MAEAVLERLNRLQEADLGTARREEISTADRSFDARLMRLEVIETSRRSNVPGTLEQQIAQTNRDRLDAWTNIHKTIGDTGDLEQLDNLLDGQSHRLRLKDELRKGNTHDQRPPDRSQRAFRDPTQNIPVISDGRTQNQAVIYGTSPRSMPAPSGAPRAAQSNQLPRKQKPTLPRSRRALDPALDINNPVDDTSTSTFQISGRPSRSAQTAPIQRARARPRRPPISGSSSSSSSVYSQKISSPEDFLAEARSVTRGSEQESLIQKPKVKVPAKATDRRVENSCLTPRSPSVVKLKEQEDSTQLTASAIPEDNGESTDHDLGTGSVSADSPEETRAAASSNTTDQEKTEEKPVLSPQGPVIDPMDSTPVSRPQRAVGMLVDLDSAMDSRAAAGMSPALQELEGLDFTQTPKLQSSQSSTLASVNRKLDFGGILHEEQQMASELDNPKAATHPEDEELAEEYRREIDIICQLLERTHLSDTFLSKLTECKEELETRLRQRRNPNLDSHQSQQVLTPPAPKLEKPEIAASAGPPEAVAPGPKEPEDFFPAGIESTAPHTRHTSTSRISTPSSPSRLNARVPQYMPKSLSNTTSDSVSLHPIPNEAVNASQSKSALSEDIAVPVTVDTPSPRPQPALTPTLTLCVREASGTGHLSGDHLLPGSIYRQPEESHLYGDHLLHGGRVTPTTIIKPTVPRTAKSVLDKAAAPKPVANTFSIFPPSIQVQTALKLSPATLTISAPSKPVKVVGPNSLVNSKANSSNSASAAVTAQASTTPQITQKATSMMESIYAPKPNVASSSTMNVTEGLSASRYSDPKWL